jgi:hypothetical protein
VASPSRPSFLARTGPHPLRVSSTIRIAVREGQRQRGIGIYEGESAFNLSCCKVRQPGASRISLVSCAQTRPAPGREFYPPRPGHSPMARNPQQNVAEGGYRTSLRSRSAMVVQAGM